MLSCAKMLCRVTLINLLVFELLGNELTLHTKLMLSITTFKVAFLFIKKCVALFTVLKFADWYPQVLDGAKNIMYTNCIGGDFCVRKEESY